MAHQIVRDAKLFVHGYDLSGDTSALALAHGVETKDVTTLGKTSRARLPGLKDVSISHEGFWEGGADAVDDALFSRIGVADTPVTIGPLTGAAGELAYTFLADMASYAPGGPVGEAFGFSVTAEGTSNLVRGTLLHNATVTATGSGTAYEVGAVGSTQKLYAALHVISASASDTLDVIIESDTVGFGSATTRVTFSQVSDIGSQWATPVSGAITDTYWRVTHTIAGTDPSFEYVVVIGIL